MPTLQEIVKKGFFLLDIVIIIVIILLMFSEYWWLALIGLLGYSLYAVYKGWNYIQLLFSMIDVALDKYKRSKVKNGKSKNR